MNKHIFFMMLVAVGFLSCNTQAQHIDYESDKIATFVFYNVENLFDTINNPEKRDDEFTPAGKKEWNSERYLKKLDDLSEVIALTNINELPEFIALCEIENKSVLLDLANTTILGKAKYDVVHYEGSDARGIDVGLLYRTDEFELLHSELIAIDIDPSVLRSPLREILYVRGTFSGKDELHIFVNHWASRRGGEAETRVFRNAAAQTLRIKVDEILATNPEAKIIISGDMNDEPENTSLSKTLRASKNLKEAEETGLFNLMYMKFINGKGTYSFRGEWNMLDNLIVSEALMNAEEGYRVTPDGGRILYDSKVLFYNSKADKLVPSKTYGGNTYFGGYSDHLPVFFMMKKQ